MRWIHRMQLPNFGLSSCNIHESYPDRSLSERRAWSAFARITEGRYESLDSIG